MVQPLYSSICSLFLSPETPTSSSTLFFLGKLQVSKFRKRRSENKCSFIRKKSSPSSNEFAPCFLTQECTSLVLHASSIKTNLRTWLPPLSQWLPTSVCLSSCAQGQASSTVPIPGTHVVHPGCQKSTFSKPKPEVTPPPSFSNLFFRRAIRPRHFQGSGHKLGPYMNSESLSLPHSHRIPPYPSYKHPVGVLLHTHVHTNSSDHPLTV